MAGQRVRRASVELDFRLLGGLRVFSGNRQLDLTAPKQRLALAVLLLERDRVVPANRLVELLWPDDDRAGVENLQVYISRLRGLLEPDRPPRAPSTVLVSQPPGYRLAVAREAVDTYRFEDEVAAGRAALRAGELSAAGDRLDHALDLWGGPLLPEFHDEPFVRADAERLDELRLSAIEAAAETRLASGDEAGAHTLLDSVASEYPMRERLHGLLALAQYRMGRQADALRTIDRCRRALADTAGLEPGHELRQLEADMLAQAPSLLLSSAPTSAARPAVVDTATPVPMVGRRHELESLERAVDDANSGRGGIAVIVGDPGVGKSRLAEAARQLGVDRGMITAAARCPESRATPAFWVWTQLIEQLPGHRVTAPTAAQAELERFGHYRAVLDAVTSGDRAVVAVIDDLQWADVDSLRLLAHIAADLASSRTLLIATVRPRADDTSDALVDSLAEVARSPGALDLTLTGWTTDDVADWLSTFGGAAIASPRSVAEAIHARTGGNPLFVKELAELLAAEGKLGDADAVATSRSIPASVQFVVRRRASGLPAATQQLLLVASVLGRSFDLDTLAIAADSSLDAVIGDVGAALDAGVLVESDGELGFSHALVADALAAEVNAVRRSAIHAAVARSLAQRSDAGFGPNVAVIAHHAREGLLAGTADLAIEAGSRAADLAGKRFAHEDAAAHWADVAAVMRRARPHDEAGLVAALTEQARALVAADQVLLAKRPILAAASVAEQAGLTTAMADALALLNNVHVWTNEPYGVIDTSVVDSITRAIDLLGDTEPERRAVLLGALAAELAFADREQHARACTMAVEAARATGDPALIARVLGNTMAINKPETLDQRRLDSAEIVSLSEKHDLGPNLLVVGHFHLAECHLEVGELDLAADQLASARSWLRWLPETRLHGQQLWFEAAIATATGRYDEADKWAAAAHDLHRRGRVYDAEALHLAGQVAFAFDRGGLEQILPHVVVDAGGYGRVIAEMMAAAALEVGDETTARSLVARFGPSAAFPDDYVTLFCAAAALHARVELGDRAGAAAAESVLAVFPTRWAGAGTSPLSMGPVSLALARYAALVGDHDRARASFEQAAVISERAAAPAWLARCLTHFAVFLHETGGRPAADRAATAAREIATRNGFPYVLRRLEASA